MKVRTKESRKRLGSLILLVAFASILFITSTFAWFSTQRNVTLSNLEGIVKVAEGLEVSMDGVNWSQQIDLSSGTLSSLGYTAKTDGDSSSNYAGNTNISPAEEMKPISTDGNIDDGMAFYSGINTNGVVLSDVSKVTEDATTGLFAFDIFLRNTSAAGVTSDPLQINEDSVVTVKPSGGNATVGLQNTVRVGFALYNGTVDTLAGKDDIIRGTVPGKTVSDIAIWEPNAGNHVDYIVTNNNRITIPTGGNLADFKLETDGKFKDGSLIPTFALNSTAIGTGECINNIYNWNNSKMTKQRTLQTTTISSATKLLSTKSTDSSNVDFALTANAISRVRVYVWLEGQDVDCTNYASHGGGIKVDLGIEKPAAARS